MVSFQASPVSSNGRKEISNTISSKKRKWEEPETSDLEGILFHHHHRTSRKPAETTKSIFEIELHLESPLPLEWQRCLNIQSGQIHFYNTRTHKRTSRDPRRSPEPPTAPDHMISLDLQLNLPAAASESKRNSSTSGSCSASTIRSFGDLLMDNSPPPPPPPPPSSWLINHERDPKEMVASVCTKCHLLVMLCKSSPACPNCKFMNPLEQSSIAPKLFKQSLSLLF